MRGTYAQFESLASALWERLGLGEPQFGEPGRVLLRIDDARVDLFDSERGQMIVESMIGNLAEDRAASSRQVRLILNVNIGLLLANDAGIYLKTIPSRETALVARSSCSYSEGRLDKLIKKIEDVVQTVEYCQEDLRRFLHQGSHVGRAGARIGDEDLVFRP